MDDRVAGEARIYRHSLRVRYGEVDRQGVVFNAHYMAYVDDAMENWLEPIAELRERERWDMMLKRFTIEWQGSVSNGDVLDIDLAVTRWGRTSWELGYRGSWRGRPVFTANVLYVSVRVPENRPMETPAAIRDYMGEAVPADLLAPLEVDSGAAS